MPVLQVMQQIGACDDEVKCGAVMEREKRLQGIVFLGGRFDYTPADLAMLNVPFGVLFLLQPLGTLIEASIPLCPSPTVTPHSRQWRSCTATGTGASPR